MISVAAFSGGRCRKYGLCIITACGHISAGFFAYYLNMYNECKICFTFLKHCVIMLYYGIILAIMYVGECNGIDVDIKT